MHLVPETGDGIVILCNSQRAWPLFAALLREWSESLGVAPVGMPNVLWAEAAARIAITMGVGPGILGLWAAYRSWHMSGLGRRVAGAAALALWPLWAVRTWAGPARMVCLKRYPITAACRQAAGP